MQTRLKTEVITRKLIGFIQNSLRMRQKKKRKEKKKETSTQRKIKIKKLTVAIKCRQLLVKVAQLHTLAYLKHHGNEI